MLRQWLLSFQDWSGLDTHQMQWIAAAFAIITGTSLWLGKSWGWAQSRHYFKVGDDRGNHAIVERLIFIPRPDGTMLFDRETHQGALPLEEILDSHDLCKIVRAKLRSDDGFGHLLPPGKDHALMMSRFDAHITGNDPAASQSAMFGRRAEYHVDKTAFTARNMIGDDEVRMVHVLLINPEYASQLDDPEFVAKLIPRRQRYKRRYFPLFDSLALEFRSSMELFEKTMKDDEEAAGQQATFWTALIRTQKAEGIISLAEVERMITNAVAKARAETVT